MNGSINLVPANTHDGLPPPLTDDASFMFPPSSGTRYPKTITPESWRANNSHNQTFIGHSIRCAKISAVNFSYGTINISEFDHPSEGLRIGHFVSIDPQVLFILGGNHPFKGFSTYPFAVMLFGRPNEARTKGEIVVSDDVWIGHGATIL